MQKSPKVTIMKTMRTIIYVVDGTEFETRDAWGQEWKEALALAKENNCGIDKAVIYTNGDIDWYFFAKGNVFLHDRFRENHKVKIFQNIGLTFSTLYDKMIIEIESEVTNMYDLYRIEIEELETIPDEVILELCTVEELAEWCNSLPTGIDYIDDADYPFQGSPR